MLHWSPLYSDVKAFVHSFLVLNLSSICYIVNSPLRKKGHVERVSGFTQSTKLILRRSSVLKLYSTSWTKLTG